MLSSAAIAMGTTAFFWAGDIITTHVGFKGILDDHPQAEEMDPQISEWYEEESDERALANLIGSKTLWTLIALAPMGVSEYRADEDEGASGASKALPLVALVTGFLVTVNNTLQIGTAKTQRRQAASSLGVDPEDVELNTIEFNGEERVRATADGSNGSVIM